MLKFKPYRKDQVLLLPSSLEDYIPEGHLAHPKILLKLLFYGYATGVRSGRKVAARCETDTAYMFLAEMYRPDFRTVNDFRKNHLSFVERYFVEVVRICKELGMVKVGEIVIDGSKMKANAAPRRSKDKAGYEAWLRKVEEEIREVLREADRVDAEEDELYGEQRGDELPGEIRGQVCLREKIKGVVSQWKAEEKEKINLTDPDSRFMKETKGLIRPSYNCQVAVGERQVKKKYKKRLYAVEPDPKSPVFLISQRLMPAQVPTDERVLLAPQRAPANRVISLDQNPPHLAKPACALLDQSGPA